MPESLSAARSRSLLEHLPEIVRAGKRRAERILEGLDGRTRIGLQTRELDPPAKDSNWQMCQAVRTVETPETPLGGRFGLVNETAGQTEFAANPLWRWFNLLSVMLNGACLGIFLSLTVHATALGTAFTYQGRLGDGGAPANGSYDLTLKLYDAVTNGAQVGATADLRAQGVTNGLFTVTLDFGADAFAGEARWLEIQVRTNGAAAYITLTPRQPLTATPYALYALTPAGPAGDTGATGPPGAQGPQGVPGLVWRGAWDVSASYATNDAVQSGGSAWAATLPNTGVAPAEGASWTMLAQKGDTGSAGPAGATGPQGATGATGPQGTQGLTGDTGATGPPGAQGPQGMPGLVWRGAWDVSASYATNDAVQSGGSAWVATLPNTGVAPAEGASWTMLAQKGDTGPAGAQVSANTRLVFEGDSLTVRPDGYAWYFMTNSAYAGWWSTNVGVNSTTAQQIFSRYTANVQPWKPAGGTNAILFVWMGANSIMMGDPLDNTWQWITNEWAAAKADGFAVAAFTITPRADVGGLAWQTEQNRVQINNLIRRSAMWDYLIDAAARFETVNSTDFLPDLLHQSATAVAQTSKMVEDALRQGPLSAPAWQVSSSPRWATDYDQNDLFDQNGTWFASVTALAEWSLPSLTVGNTYTAPELISNGGFDSGTNGWSADISALTTATDGVSGNCLLITSTVPSNYRTTAIQTVAVDIGALYHFVYWHKNGTVSGGVAVGTGWYGTDYYFGPSSSNNDVNWARHSVYFTTSATNLNLTFYAATDTSGDTTYYDSISLKKLNGSAAITSDGGIVMLLPVYTSNAAALAGGLASGTLYRNGDQVCIVH
jgi:hypothetical protein